MSFTIGGLQKTSLLDYPDKISCIVFTCNCNFRCGYCHNPELFAQKSPALTVPDFFNFLKTRKGKLDAVVITGGEPTLQSGLKEFAKKIKESDFLIKLDTNGTNPKVIEDMLDENLLDYIAMDIKAPLEKYQKIANAPCNTLKIQKSIDLIMNSGIDYEFRTTVVKSQLNFEDFQKIGELIKGAEKYYLQKFIPSKILDNSLYGEKSYSNEEFEKICKMLKKYVQEVDFR
jgi:pyruvate formate lyase activating enzyme